MVDMNLIAQAVMQGSRKNAEQLINDALAEGVKAETILKEGLTAGMTAIGVQFSAGEVYVPEVLVAARAMKSGFKILMPLLLSENVQSEGKVAIGTVEGDLHDIGKNLVGMMLEGAGFTVVDLGVDVKPEDFVNAVKEQHVQVIGMSALLTTTMPTMKRVIEALNAEGLRDKVKVMIGGAPITQEYADLIGADGYSADAASAAQLAKRLVALAG